MTLGRWIVLLTEIVRVFISAILSLKQSKALWCSARLQSCVRTMLICFNPFGGRLEKTKPENSCKWFLQKAIPLILGPNLEEKLELPVSTRNTYTATCQAVS